MDDTIPVRADEELNLKRLADYLRTRLEGANRPLRLRQFGEGAANLTYLLQFGSLEYVLRRPPLGPLAPSSHDMKREYTVLAVLFKAFPPAPRAFLYCDDPEVIGAPFLVMERRRGIVVRKQMPAEFSSSPGAPSQMSRALVETLGDFHAVDFAALGLDDLGKPAGFIQRQIQGWYQRWQRAKLEELTEIEEVYGWLEERIPASPSFSLVHNDYKLDNIMFSACDASSIVAVLDWDMCTLGDPLSDLGSLLAYWSEPTDSPGLQSMSMMPQAGFPSRAELVRLYAERRGLAEIDVSFYHTLGLFRLAVILAQIYLRFRRGQTRDPRFASFGPLLPLVARAAREVALGR